MPDLAKPTPRGPRRICAILNGHQVHDLGYELNISPTGVSKRVGRIGRLGAESRKIVRTGSQTSAELQYH